MKTFKIITSATLGALLFSGCFNGSPTPSKKGEKPTVFIESHTVEKFNDTNLENADTKGIAQPFVKEKQYLRCDMLPETVAGFAREGFEIVHEKQKADYNVEVTLLACGQGREYFEHRDANPPKERAFYKRNIAFAQEYMQKTKGVVLPNKYHNMPDRDKEALKQYFSVFTQNNGGDVQTNGYIDGVNLMGHSANYLSFAQNSGSSGANALGGTGLALGFLMMATSVRNPDIYNELKITKTSSGKSFSKVVDFNPYTSQEWRTHMKFVENSIDAIAWSELE